MVSINVVLDALQGTLKSLFSHLSNFVQTRKRRKKKGRRDLTRESSSGTSNGLSTQSSVSDTTSVGAVVFGSKRGRGGK